MGTHNPPRVIRAEPCRYELNEAKGAIKTMIHRACVYIGSKRSPATMSTRMYRCARALTLVYSSRVANSLADRSFDIRRIGVTYDRNF